jgi:hypothetical protein
VSIHNKMDIAKKKQNKSHIAIKLLLTLACTLVPGLLLMIAYRNSMKDDLTSNDTRSFYAGNLLFLIGIALISEFLFKKTFCLEIGSSLLFEGAYLIMKFPYKNPKTNKYTDVFKFAMGMGITGLLAFICGFIIKTKDQFKKKN